MGAPAADRQTSLQLKDRFRLDITGLAAQNVGLADFNFFGVSCSLPGISTSEIPVSSRFGRTVLQPEQITWSNLTIDYLVDEGIKTYRNLISWVTTVKDPKELSGTLPLKATGILHILDNFYKPRVKVTFAGLMLSDVSELTFVLQDQAVFTGTAVFAFDYFEIEDEEEGA
jgi:hypothetical protein